MAYPARLLGEDEYIEYETRPHWRVLAMPLLSFLLIVGIAAYLFGKVQSNSTWQTGLRWVVFLVAASAFSYWVVRPFIAWATSLYVFTNRRIITRTGLVARRGRDMPLSRVNDVSFSHSVLERIFNCGTLLVESAGETGQLRIENVPDVEDLQREIYRLHEADDLRRRRDMDPRTQSHSDPRSADPYSADPRSVDPYSDPHSADPHSADPRRSNRLPNDGT